jgi:Fe-S-cluster-containing dehydrogenase component/formate-dependent nitrite reductase membrane component NrfD
MSVGATLPTSRWAKVIDNTRCIGCHACSTACKSENQVPLGVHRTYVKYVDIGRFPQARRVFQVTRCNQCADPPCATACPTAAMYQRPDGIVDFDKSVCIGCKACIAACPYDAIFINPEDQTAEKCNFCAHRIDQGLEPACVVVCPTEAILVGSLDDPSSKVAQIVNREAVTVRGPEKYTDPKLFYRGAHQATLDPLAAAAPAGGLFIWSEQGRLPHQVTRESGARNGAADAVLAYDVPHRIPWDWRVSLYTWTKGIASGSWLVAAVLVALGKLSDGGPLWTWLTPAVAALFLGLTGALLIGDLSHPERCYLIFTRPQWRSWLVRGAFVLAAFGAVIGLHIVATFAGLSDVRRALVIPGIPVSLFGAVYTAYLFAQARGRDLWQSPLLPAQLAIQAVLAGACVLGIAAVHVEPGAAPTLAYVVAAGALAHLLVVAGEATLTHTTAHAGLAIHVMTRGRYARFFWVGVALMAAGCLAPWLGTIPAVAALLGLLAYEHAHVQAAQAVPLA